MPIRPILRNTLLVGGAIPLLGGMLASTAGATRPAPLSVQSSKVFQSTVFASGADLTHSTPTGPEAISQPDDITSLGGALFVGFQNGVGPQGEPSTTGNTKSTVVEFDRQGRPLEQWDLVGKCDGLTADPATGQLIATVNEDANSSVYLIDVDRPSWWNHPTHPVQYHYDRPLPSKGGTDAISVYRGIVLISASAPGTTGAAAPQPTYPAVYRATFNPTSHVATIHPVFFDEAPATIANLNSPTVATSVRLALTDPDSNEVVPPYAKRFAGDFMLTSQGDEEQIFAGKQHLAVLKLSNAVDDTAWASDRSGAIYTINSSGDTIEKITGPFNRGAEFVAVTPCDAIGAPSVCPGPGFPANYIGQLNPGTGTITPVSIHGATVDPKGMLFLS